MLISLSSFSQTDTKTQQVSNNDTIKLHKEVAKKVVKDLMYLDVLKQERILLLENIDTLKNQKSYKDSIIFLKDDQIGYYKKTIDLYKTKEDTYTNAITKLKLEVKRQKLSSKISFGLLALAAGVVLIK